MNRKKVVVITGVSTGIGLGLAHKYLEQGWIVYGSVRKAEDAAHLVKKTDFKVLRFDVTDHEAIKKAAKWVLQEQPEGIDLLINNAGIAVGGPLTLVPIKDMRHQFEVNVFGVLKVIQAFYPLLKSTQKKAPGRIIQMSSVSGKIGFPFVGPYSSSKFALEGMSESLRRELRKDQIKVITIGPGAVKTPIWEKSVAPVAEKYQDSEYADAIKKVNKFFIQNAVKKGLTVDYLTEKVYQISVHKDPKVRYTFASKKLTNWYLPRILPAKWIDRIMTRSLFK